MRLDRRQFVQQFQRDVRKSSKSRPLRRREFIARGQGTYPSGAGIYPQGQGNSGSMPISIVGRPQ